VSILAPLPKVQFAFAHITYVPFFRYPGNHQSTATAATVPLSRIFQESIDMNSARGCATKAIKTVSDRRSNSYSQLIRSARLRLQMQLFLSRVFNVTSASAMYSKILAAVYHRDNFLDDMTIYRYLTAHATPEGPLAALSSQWKKIVQLREQKVEFRDEVSRILGRLGVVGLVKDYVAVGDNGRMVLELNSLCGVDGNVWTVDPPEPTEVTIEAAVNRFTPGLALIQKNTRFFETNIAMFPFLMSCSTKCDYFLLFSC
jgi:hypothetical protein